jgi:hypothetical protein
MMPAFDYGMLLWLSIAGLLAGMMLLLGAAFVAVNRHPDVNDPRRSGRVYTVPAGAGFLLALLALCGILLALLGLWLT